MSRFHYLRDPLFVASCTAYGVNRWLLKPHVHSAFLHSHFNDLLLIPCALPPVLLAQRLLGVRRHDQTPQPSEIGLHLLVWSLLFEVLGPRLFIHATGDPLDVAAYLTGGIAAGLLWNAHAPTPSPANNQMPPFSC
jgi:hypothetical protein